MKLFRFDDKKESGGESGGGQQWITVNGAHIPLDGKSVGRGDVTAAADKHGLHADAKAALVRAHGAGQIQTDEHLHKTISHAVKTSAGKTGEEKSAKGFHTRAIAAGLKAHGASKEQSEKFLADRNARIMGKLPKIAAGVPKMRQAIQSDIGKPGLPKEKVGAVVARIMDATTMRVGSEAYATKSARGKTGGDAASQDSFGASSLRKSHVSVDGDTVHFNFPGKSKKNWERSVQDAHLASAVSELLKEPGDRLMQYKDASGKTKSFTETDAQEYLRPHGLTPKNLRTHHATRIAEEHLSALPKPKTLAEAKKNVADAAVHTSKLLGNTPSIALKSYIDPAVVHKHLAGLGGTVNMSKNEADKAPLMALIDEIFRGGGSTFDPDDDDDGDEYGEPDDDDDGEQDDDETETQAGKEKSFARFSIDPTRPKPIHFSVTLPQRTVEGDFAVYTGAKLFESGVFADKGFEVTNDDMDRWVANWKPIRGNMEHKDMLQGRACEIPQAWRDGNNLRGNVRIPLGLDNLMEPHEKKLSMEFLAGSKTPFGVALTSSPRISDAVLMSLDTEFKAWPRTVSLAPKSARKEPKPMTLKSIIAEFFSSLKGGEVDDAKIAKFSEDLEKVQEPAIADFSAQAASNQKLLDEIKASNERIVEMSRKSIQAEAEAYADKLIRDEYATAAERGLLIAQFSLMAGLDSAKTVTFSASDGKDATLPNALELWKAGQEARQKIFGFDPEAVSVFATTLQTVKSGAPKTMTPDRRAQLLAHSSLGQKALTAKN